MKKILLLASIGALFLSCSDLSSNREESLKDELPGDFKYGVYADINNDVEKSQILLEIQEKVASLYGTGEADTERKKECGNILLQDISLFDAIYEDFMDCPAKGWNPNKPCSGKYAGNANYTKFTVAGEDTTWRCAVGGCWSGGLNDLFTDYDQEDGEEYCIVNTCLPPLKGLLTGEDAWPGINYLASGDPGKINYYMNSGTYARRDAIDTLISVVCKFIMPELGSAQAAKNYLQNFPYDTTLIKQHYFLFGRSEGRPYKYCNNGETVERNRDKHALLLTNAQLASFYDYSRYLFCLNDKDYKVYETQEDK